MLGPLSPLPHFPKKFSRKIDPLLASQKIPQGLPKKNPETAQSAKPSKPSKPSESPETEKQTATQDRLILSPTEPPLGIYNKKGEIR
jgi:hypothetical protein